MTTKLSGKKTWLEIGNVCFSTCQNVHTHKHTVVDIFLEIFLSPQFFPHIQSIVLISRNSFFFGRSLHFERLTLNHSHIMFDNVLCRNNAHNVSSYLMKQCTQNESHRSTINDYRYAFNYERILAMFNFSPTNRTNRDSSETIVECL